MAAPECFACAGITPEEIEEALVLFGLSASASWVTLECGHSLPAILACPVCSAMPYAGLVNGQWKFAHSVDCECRPGDLSADGNEPYFKRDTVTRDDETQYIQYSVIRDRRCAICHGMTEDEYQDCLYQFRLTAAEETESLRCGHVQPSRIFCPECQAVPFGTLNHGQWDFAHLPTCPVFPQAVPMPKILAYQPAELRGFTTVIRCRVVRDGLLFPMKYSSFDHVCNKCQKYVYGAQSQPA